MARTERQVPSVYFGRPGALVTLPWPRGDMDRPYSRLTYDFVTGTGQHVITSHPVGARTKLVTWNALHYDTYAQVSQYWEGGMGVGPWAFSDPAVPNLLMPNQASTTNTLYDTTGWKTANSLASEGSLFSNTDVNFIHRVGATRSLRWQWPVTLSARPTLVPTSPYRNWISIPVVPGLPYSFSAWVRADGVVDSAIGANIRIRWLDVTNAVISDSSNPAVLSYTTITPTWARLSVTGTAPGNAAWGTPGIVVDETSVTVGGSLYVDEPLYEQDSAVNTWAPGSGCRAVEIMSLSDKAPFVARFRQDVQLVLQELVE